MNLEEMEARRAEIAAEMRSILTAPEDAGDDWDVSEEDATRFDALEAETTGLAAKIKTRSARLAALDDASERIAGDDKTTERHTVNFNTKRNPFDLDTIRFDSGPSDLRARATTAVESMERTDDATKAAAIETLGSVRQDRGEVAKLMLATGSEEYRSAFAKAFAATANGRIPVLTTDESRMLERAQSLTDNAGGYAVPFTLDPTVLFTNSSAINPMREIASVKQISTDSWNGVTSAGATASWDGEAAEVSDDAMTLAQPSVAVHKMQVFIPFSVEIEDDWAALDSDARMAMVDARDRLEATAHMKGSGSGQPFGLETALDGTASEIAPATAETFAAADVYNLQRLVPPRYRANRDMPKWIMGLGTANDIRQFDTSGGGNFWSSLGNGAPERLLGWEWHESSECDDSADIDASASADNFVLFAGDPKRYVIVDRVGMRVELIPHLFATGNNRPSGQRGLIGWLRTGADLIDNNAFRVLSIPTTA